jgi:5-methylcytosine-specific restriction endonuclease McrA
MKRRKKQYASLAELRDRAFKRQNGLCYWCGKEMIYHGGGELPKPWNHPNMCTADHLVRSADGGKTITGNIVAACQKCNSTRHNRTIHHHRHNKS